MIFLTASPKSLFLSVTAFCPAAKCEQTKQTEEPKYRKRMATVPLLPVAPPIPVLTLSIETSVIWMGTMKPNNSKATFIGCSGSKIKNREPNSNQKKRFGRGWR